MNTNIVENNVGVAQAVTPQPESNAALAEAQTVSVPETSTPVAAMAEDAVDPVNTDGKSAVAENADAEPTPRKRRPSIAAVPLAPASTLVKAKASKKKLTSGLQVLECRGVLQHPKTFAYTIRFVAKQDKSVVFEREQDATENGPELGSDLHHDLETLCGEELTQRKLEALTANDLIGRQVLGVVRLGFGRRRPSVDGLFTAQAVKALLEEQE
jgi:hypothetical protein